MLAAKGRLFFEEKAPYYHIKNVLTLTSLAMRDPSHLIRFRQIYLNEFINANSITPEMANFLVYRTDLVDIVSKDAMMEICKMYNVYDGVRFTLTPYNRTIKQMIDKYGFDEVNLLITKDVLVDIKKFDHYVDCDNRIHI